MKQGFLYILIVFLFLTVIFFGFAYVESTDRYRFEIEKMRKAVENLQEQIESVQAMPQADISADSSGSPVANAEYYDPQAVSGDRFVVAIPADAGNLNPLTNNDAAVSSMWGIANSSLTERDYSNVEVFRPLMAESWSVSEDNMTWHIKLRPGILWHDFTDPVTGKQWKNVPVTSRDFKFYVDAVKNPDVDAQPLRGYYSGIREVNIINDLEFEVVWQTPYFLSKDITLGLMPLPKHLYHDYDGPFDGKKFNDDTERNRMIIGCGPYRLERWEKGRRFIFKRFEKFFGRRYGVRPPIQYYVFEIIQHPGTRFQALLSGDIDKNNITPEQWLNNTSSVEFRQGGSLRKVQTPSFSYSYIGLNQHSPLFKDRRVRVALSMLVNRDRLLNDVYRGLARPVSGPFFMDGNAYDKSIKPYPFDPEKAGILLADAGWRDSDGDGILDKDGVPFRFTLMFPSANPVYPRIAPILKEDFAKAGIRLELLALEWSVVIEKLELRNFEAAIMGWTTPIESDPYQLWHSDYAEAERSSNFIAFSDPRADALIQQIRTTFDQEQRLQAYRKFHQLIHEEQPYLFLFSPYSLSVYSARYRNLKVFPLGVAEQILWTPKTEQRAVSGL